MQVDSYKKREGFSLIELIIAIAILTIFVGGTALSISLLRSADTKGLANGINNSLTDLKAMTEAHRGPFYLHIYKAGNGYYACYNSSPTFTDDDKDPDNHENIGSEALNVTVSYDGVVTHEVVLDESTPVTLAIQKKDGAYIDVKDSTDTVISPVPKYFVVLNGTDRDYQVFLAKNTGLHYIDQVSSEAASPAPESPAP